MMGGSIFIITFDIYLKDSIRLFTWMMVTIEGVSTSKTKTLVG